MNSDATPPGANEEEAAADTARREALRKIALYGAVGGPVLLGMLQSEKAVAQTVRPPA